MLKFVISTLLCSVLAFCSFGAEKLFKDMNGSERYQALKAQLFEKFNAENPDSFDVIKEQCASFCAEQFKNAGLKPEDSKFMAIDLARNIGADFSGGKFIVEAFEFAKANAPHVNLVFFYAHRQKELRLSDEEVLNGLLDAVITKRYSGIELSTVVSKVSILSSKVDIKEEVIKGKLQKINRFYASYLVANEDEYTGPIKALRTLISTY